MIQRSVTETQAAILDALTQGRGARLLHHALHLPQALRGRGEVKGSAHRINGELLPSYTVAALVSRGLVRLRFTERDARHYVITEAGREALAHSMKGDG